jgi:hypothetical protein
MRNVSRSRCTQRRHTLRQLQVVFGASKAHHHCHIHVRWFAMCVCDYYVVTRIVVSAGVDESQQKQ